MGQMADDIVEGLACSWCGCYFEQSNEFPAACAECWEDAGLSLTYDRFDPPEEAVGVNLSVYKLFNEDA